MAKAIKQIDITTPSQEEEQAEAVNKLIGKLADNQESLTKTLEIVQELDGVGILDMAKGALKTRQELGVLAMDQINQPEMHRMIKNGMMMVSLLNKIDPDQLEKVSDAMNHGLEHMTSSDEDAHLGLWKMAKAMKDPDINRSLYTLFEFLKGFGQALDKAGDDK
ncbi:DUF1641 domain-containing protein [Tuberibacillus sp. Marseille-P3662]|uniref:DUF1641 domain-containing protein n=1 Tax=Tuberibacillus sp. Marseille-P3662 TaxID=1965358 RepID=UPI001594B518|nr:DUF1641 domain-containing protein [Tuberibacillus sp. Marseille-P3662]